MNVGIRLPYLRVVGIDVDMKGPGRTTGITFTPTEEETFRTMCASPNIYETVAKSVAPAIYGCDDMKKAIACLLFGGSRKRLVSNCFISPDSSRESWNFSLTVFRCL